MRHQERRAGGTGGRARSHLPLRHSLHGSFPEEIQEVTSSRLAPSLSNAQSAPLGGRCDSARRVPAAAKLAQNAFYIPPPLISPHNFLGAAESSRHWVLNKIKN